MKYCKRLHDVLRDECGAVLVDWMVLTAVLVGIGVGVLGVIGPSVTDVAARLTTVLEQSQN